MGQTTAADLRCPQCSAAVRSGAPWCSQCYTPAGAADVPPPPVPATAPVEQRAPSPASTGRWPCSACDQDNDIALDACQGCGTPFLAQVRAARPTTVLPVVGDLLTMSPARRVGLATGAVLAFVVGAALLVLLLA